LFDRAWAEYAAHADLTKAGRGTSDMLVKCYALLRNQAAGRVRRILAEPPDFSRPGLILSR
jgi:hypothetical protein